MRVCRPARLIEIEPLAGSRSSSLTLPQYFIKAKFGFAQAVAVNVGINPLRVAFSRVPKPSGAHILRLPIVHGRTPSGRCHRARIVRSVSSAGQPDFRGALGKRTDT